LKLNEPNGNYKFLQITSVIVERMVFMIYIAVNVH
jgi:hypothetical protein